MADGAPETEALVASAAAGDSTAWGKLLTAHQERLWRMVAFRMDPRLRGRVDAADIARAVESFEAHGMHVDDQTLVALGG